ncbi:MAG: DUF3301 domain-containing protein [Betaproteobacteria bacterium]|nr:DUF3301 domain-containing protein [Betaproteobacteria bacterium]
MNFIEISAIAMIAAALWFWLDTLKAREAGIRAARQACAEDGLQFLDESVVGRSLWPARDDAGQLRLRRVYRFEFSDTGDNRRSGSIVLLGDEVEFLHLCPQREAMSNPEHYETFH